ncbi:hypothetical protein FQA39_LY07457 [Lamprigera yunnana]|nr:hypothetical protein FQA39_LY07457 [Lamprigera yunnana]
MEAVQTDITQWFLCSKKEKKIIPHSSMKLATGSQNQYVRPLIPIPYSEMQQEKMVILNRSEKTTADSQNQYLKPLIPHGEVQEKKKIIPHTSVKSAAGSETQHVTSLTSHGEMQEEKKIIPHSSVKLATGSQNQYVRPLIPIPYSEMQQEKMVILNRSEKTTADSQNQYLKPLVPHGEVQEKKIIIPHTSVKSATGSKNQHVTSLTSHGEMQEEKKIIPLTSVKLPSGSQNQYTRSFTSHEEMQEKKKIIPHMSVKSATGSENQYATSLTPHGEMRAKTIYTISHYFPLEWVKSNMYTFNKQIEYDIPAHDPLYEQLSWKVSGMFNLGVTRITRVENQYLYGQFLIKKEEYESRGLSVVKELYHDTGSDKVQSILNKNLDRRYAYRVKYGCGVSFSPYPRYANQQSSRNNGTTRAMIVADVLVFRSEKVNSNVILPSQGYDTTIGNCGQVILSLFEDYSSLFIVRLL